MDCGARPWRRASQARSSVTRYKSLNEKGGVWGNSRTSRQDFNAARQQKKRKDKRTLLVLKRRRKRRRRNGPTATESWKVKSISDTEALLVRLTCIKTNKRERRIREGFLLSIGVDADLPTMENKSRGGGTTVLSSSCRPSPAPRFYSGAKVVSREDHQICAIIPKLL